MDAKQLGKKLKEMYEVKGVSQTTMIHIFGILYANEIDESDVKLSDIIKEAGMNESYHVEISKGIRLSEYVSVNEKCYKLLLKI